MNTPLFYKGEIVRYGKENLLCVILDAFHYGRDYPRQQYRERYIIHSLDKDKPFEHDVIYAGVKYPSTNFCAGEFLKKTKEKAPLFYNINTEEIFEELYD
mgnify:FL=1